MGFLPDPLHPAVIHFPIALSLVALLFDLLARHPRLRGLESAAAVLIVLAALGAVAAVVTGNMAHDDAVIPTGARSLVEQHEELGETAMWGLIVVALVRVVLAWRRQFAGVLAWVAIALVAAAAGAVAYNGHLGGELVFTHGVGTMPVQRSTMSPAAPSMGQESEHR